MLLVVALIVAALASEEKQDLEVAAGHNRGYGGHGYEYGLDYHGNGGYGGHGRGYKHVYNHGGHGGHGYGR